MANDFDPLAGMGGQKPKRQKRVQKSDALKNMSSKAKVVSNRKTDAKGRARKTLYISDELQVRIEDVANAEGATISDMYEWMLVQGLLAYEDGARPDFDKREVRRSLITDYSRLKG